MSKVYVCYMISTGIDNTTNILGVYDSFEKAVGRNARAFNNIVFNEKTFERDFNTSTGFGYILFEYNGSLKLKVQEIDLNKDITLN